jgi:hypothetical protein
MNEWQGGKIPAKPYERKDKSCYVVEIWKNGERIRTSYFNHNTHGGKANSLAAANVWRYAMIQEHNLLVKNKYRLVEDYAEVKLDNNPGTVMKVDLIDLSLVERCTWCFHKGYAVNQVGGFHDLVIGRTPKDTWIADHIDSKQTLDNRRCNLRRANYKLNAQNQKTPKNNTSGRKGVHTCRGYWIASWRVNGREHRRRFSINKYGSEVAKEMAIEARNDAWEHILNCEGDG